MGFGCLPSRGHRPPTPACSEQFVPNKEVALRGVGRAAGTPAVGTSGRQAVLFLIDRVSFEQMMAVPELRQLARAGGAALMTTRVDPDHGETSGYATIGAGTIST